MTDSGIRFIFQVREADAHSRLDRFLALKVPDLSRSQLKRCVESGEVLIDNVVSRIPHAPLKTGQSVQLEHQPTEPVQPDHWDRIRCLHAEDTFLIIDKPAGVLAHPVPNRPERTLVDWLVERYPDIRSVGEDLTRPGIVHRLDRLVSGLMVVPRTNQAFEYLKAQFETRQVQKTYLTLVHGLIEHDGSINLPIARSQSDRRRMAVRLDHTGRAALTNYIVLKRISRFTLLEVHPATGRGHQIRVHLNTLGHPIVGDPLYHPKKLKPVPLGRLFLHSHRISFVDLKEDPRAFVSPLPPELEGYLSRLN